MRLWLQCIVILCASFKMACVAIDVTNIKSITTKDGQSVANNGKKLLLVCYEGNTDGDHTALEVIIDGSTEFDHPYIENTAEDSTPDHCKYFEGTDIAISTNNGVELKFLLLGKNTEGETLTSGIATFTIPADGFIGDGGITAQTVGARPTKAVADSLRIETSTGGWEVCKEDNTQTTLVCNSNTGTPCYALEIGTSSTFSLCIKNKVIDGESDDAVLISGTIEPTTTTVENGLQEAILTYGALLNSLQIKSDSNSITEFVAYKQDDPSTVYTICVEAANGCNLASYVNTDNRITTIIVLSADASTSNVITFKDYSIKSTKLGATIVEMFWKRDDDHLYYGSTIAVKTVPETPVESVVTDCSVDDAFGTTYCFAYFIKLDAGTPYLATVAPNPDGVTLEMDKTNQIIPASVTPERVLSTRFIGVTMQQDSSHDDGVLQVCYNTRGSNHNNTRHEAILIDEDGHWIKMYQSKQEEGLMNCFSPVNLLTSSLIITKDTKLTAVIVERELTEYQVLASGQADIDLSGLRVIKPDEDNSSDGSTSTLAIIGAAIGGVACLMALVAAAILFVMKRKRNNDGLQYPLDRTNVEDVNVIHGLDNPNST